MDITEPIIQKFFDGLCAADEAEAVADYLILHPEILENRFQEEWVANESFPLSRDEYIAMWQNIQSQITPEYAEEKRPRSMFYRVMAAASVLAVLAASYLFFLSGSKSGDTEPARDVVKTSGPEWKLRCNLTPTVMSDTLEDHSVVRLQPGAAIRYMAFAGRQARDIYLTGEAFFSVAKDKTKPFTVFAGPVATTAVGTRFLVRRKKEKITVRLYEGKVKIAVVATVAAGTGKYLYLDPGQQFMYDSITASFTVSRMEKIKKPARPDVSEGKNAPTTLSAAHSANWYMFNNQALPKVFEQLQELYNVKISYDKVDFRNVYFIGKFEKTDSLEHILHTIALLKKLKVYHKDNRYVISKKTH